MSASRAGSDKATRKQGCSGQLEREDGSLIRTCIRKNSTLVETCVTRSIGQVVAECKVPAKLALSTDMCRCCDILFITLCNFVFFSCTDLGFTATALLHHRAVMARKIFTGILSSSFYALPAALGLLHAKPCRSNRWNQSC